MNFYYPLVLFPLLFVSLICSAQEAPNCGTDRLYKRSKKNQNFNDRQNALESTTYLRQLNEMRNKGSRNQVVHTIPVVFHIMHEEGEAIGTGTNISESRILQEIVNINDAFRNIGDYAGGPFHTTAGIASQDIEIEFCLADTDPIGFPTNGIIRFPSINTDLVADAPGIDIGPEQDRDLQHLSFWPSTDYLNIWVVKDIIFLDGFQAAGYAYLPGAHGSFYDGAVMDATYVGTSTDASKVMVHEAGHYLNLRHTWQGGCLNDQCLLDGDMVCDTPPDNSNIGGACNIMPNTCDTDANSGPYSFDATDNHENYMDYSSSLCQNTFTPDQKIRMREALTMTRASLLSSSACSGTGIIGVEAAFHMSERIVSEYPIETNNSDCRGDYRDIVFMVRISNLPTSDVTLTLNNSGSAEENVDYQLMDGTLTFTTTGSLFKFGTIRIFDDEILDPAETIILSYSITGPASSASTNQTMTITIKDNETIPVAPGSGFFSEDFEGSPSGWSSSCFCSGFNFSEENIWTIGPNGNLSGSNSAYVTTDYLGTKPIAYNTGSGVQRPLLRSPQIDATGYGDLTLQFDYLANGELNDDYGAIYYRFGGSGNFSSLVGDGSGPFVDQGLSVSNFSYQLPASFDGQIIEFAFEWRSDDDNLGSMPPFAIDNIAIQIPSSDIETEVNYANSLREHSLYLGPESTAYFYDQSNGNLIMKIENLTNWDYGCTTVGVDRSVTSEGGAYAVEFNSPENKTWITSKTYFVNPTNNNPNGEYTITLYYKEAEIEGWKTETINDVSVLSMIKSSNPISTINSASPDSDYVYQPFDNTVSGSNFGSNDYAFEATFNSGFSGFSIGPDPAILSVEFNQIKATAMEESILVEWKVDEVDNKGFFLTRKSEFEKEFKDISWIPSKFENGIGRFQYLYNDEDVNPGVSYYYQIRSVSFSDEEALSKVVVAKLYIEETLFWLGPNPTFDFTNLYFSSNEKHLEVIVYNELGQKIFTNSVNNLTDGDNSLLLDCREWSPGVYFIHLKGSPNPIVKKIIVL